MKRLFLEALRKGEGQEFISEHYKMIEKDEARDIIFECLCCIDAMQTEDELGNVMIEDIANNLEEEWYGGEDMTNLFEIEELEMRGYDGVFKLRDSKIEDCTDNIDDEEWCYTVASATYYDEKRNNTLYLSEIRYEGEEIEDISVVINAISNEAYSYLINVLNTNENVSVHWSQVYGTTSDYTIVYGDCDDETYKILLDEISGFKYTYIKDGQVYKIQRQEML